MYELAFQYKKTKLWKKLYDSQVFAVRLPDGEMGYCSVMGMLGEHLALAVYIGDRGYQSYRKIAFSGMEPMDPEDAAGYPEWLMAQDCLQCTFESREFMREEDLEEVRRYAKAHKLTLRGPNAFPQFSKFVPNRYPWTFETELDENRICEALEAAIFLSEALKNRTPYALGLYEVEEDTETVPLLERSGDTFRLDTTPLPPEDEIPCPAPDPVEPEMAERVRALKKKGILECGIVRIPEPVQSSPDSPPWFPLLLLCVNSRSGMATPVPPANHFEERPTTLRNNFLEMLLETKSCPKAVKVADQETRALLEDFCTQCGVLLSVSANLPGFQSARDILLDNVMNRGDDEDDEDDLDDELDEEDQIAQILDNLMDLPDYALKSLPREMVGFLLHAPGVEVPEELARRLRRLFKM